jgi:tetratricopeptide (TPR) repeat protein
MARGFERIGERGEAARFLDRAAYPARAEATSFSSDDSANLLAADAQLRPGDPAAVVPMIRAQIDSGDRGGALARAQQIARANPGAPGAHIVVGDVLMLLDRYGEAAAAYQRAADLRFDEPVMLRLVEALDRAGRRAEASNALALFMSQNPVNVAALRLTAHWQLAGGEYDAAIDTLEMLRLRIGDRDAGLETDLSAAYAGAGENEAAQRHGQTAYILQPSNPAAADAFGWAMFRNGDTAGALELLQKAVVLAPRHSGLRWHLAQVYAEANRKPEARLHAQAALADPRFPERAAASALVARFS